MTDLPDILDLTPNGLHQPFLEKAVDGDDSSPEGMLAAFLTLRVIDQFANGAAPSDATIYQIRATQEYLERLDGGLPEVGYLLVIVRTASDSVRQADKTLILEPLIAFADWLIQGLRLTQALDVLNTALRAYPDQNSHCVLRLQLKRGPLLRQMGLFVEANDAYSTAEHLAAAQGDVHRGLLAQIGQGVVLQRRGNLPAARATLEKVKHRAQDVGDRDAEARATHDLAVNSIFQARYAEAAWLAFKAFELYEDTALRRMTLSDLGVALKNLGHFVAARDALEVVVEQEDRSGPRTNALLELLAIAGLSGDQIGFERYRRQVSSVRNLPPQTMVDFHTKVGVALAGFGQIDKAIPLWQQAMEIAEHNNLNRQLFEVERLLDEAQEQQKQTTAPAPRESVADAVGWDDQVDQVAKALQELRREPELVSTYQIPGHPWEHNHHSDQ